MNFQPINQPACFFRLERSIKRPNGMGVEIVLDKNYFFRVGIHIIANAL